ncbi:unnamed protein product [Parnassius apollo]|uniref:(apollo) hypothetical protein n=1 Tax=Parnassius apollo TaxID=110799 RepID=A0A8S3YHK3_PARAO|nr:unnamed protein product [Parnassius apollo]
MTNSFMDEDEEPIIVCFICQARLIRCRTLQQQAIESNAVLEQLLAGGSKSIPKPHEARDKIQFTPINHIDIWPVECDIENHCKDDIFSLESVKVEEEKIENENFKFEVNWNHETDTGEEQEDLEIDAFEDRREDSENDLPLISLGAKSKLDDVDIEQPCIQTNISPTETNLARGSRRGRGVRTRGGRGPSQVRRSPSENDLPSNDGSHRGHGSRGDRGNHYGGERPNSRRHRGGRRGRGGHDNQPSQARISELDLIRAQRQLTQKRVAALPAEVKRELLTRKRDSEVARVIMPDAPPRKRRARLASPEREPCEFMEPECDSQRKKIIILEDIQLVPPKHAEIMANVEIHNIQQSPPGDVEIDEIELSPPRDVEIQDLKPRDLLRIGTSDLDTVPYSPDYLDSLDPDRLDTEINRALMAKTPKKRGIPSANSSSINPLID